MAKILMCRPDYYKISYEINPWMNMQRQVEHARAVEQWQQLYTTLQACGAQIELVPPAPNWPDMVFTANAGLLIHNKVFLSRFKHPERQGEFAHFKTWFSQEGFIIASEPANEFATMQTSQGLTQEYCGPTFEGEGDGLFAGKILFAGFGFRSDKKYFSRFAAEGIATIVYCELIDPYFYHLDTCFCPLNERQALWWPGAFAPESQQRMQEKLELFTVPATEAKLFACNSVVLGKQVIVPSGSDETAALLKNLGYSVHFCEMSEYIKAGGACKCLTLFLEPSRP